MPRVLLAPDKFKGSLTSTQVAQALASGMLRARPDLELDLLPVADGGDGTVDAAVAAGYERIMLTATGPTGRRVRTSYARQGATAVVEVADVAGLARLPEGRTAPMTATSRGVGEVIAAALRDGCTDVIVGVGGSACTDGGAGLLQALGARLSTRDGDPIGPGGAGLAELAHIDLEPLRKRTAEACMVVACDVDNPLCGPRGAAAVYGPQKGADPDQVASLDAALSRYADLVAAHTGVDYREHPGAGAAGGIGFAMMAMLGAQLRPGIELILSLLDFQTRVATAALVVTGEGSLDEQTLHGKAVAGVVAGAGDVPVVAVCGRSTLDRHQVSQLGLRSVYTLSDLEADRQRSMSEAAQLLVELGAQVATREL